SDAGQQQVHGTIVAVEHVPPDGRYDDRGNHDGQDVQRAVDTPALQTLDIEQEGDPDTQHEVDADVGDRPEDVVDDKPKEVVVRDRQLARDDVGVVVEPDVVRRDAGPHVQVHRRHVRERHPDLKQERVDRDHAHDREGRDEVEVRTTLAAPAT